MNKQYEQMVAGYEESIKQFDSYRKNYADVECCSSPMKVEHLLSDWAESKSDLWQMFGEQLILTKEVTYQRGFEELREEMEIMLTKHCDFIQTFFARLQEELNVNPIYYRDYAYCDDTLAERFYYLCRSALNENNLVEARLNDDTPEVTINGTKIRLARGQKTMRAIGKVARALNLAREFENFRVAHSMVLNQAKLTGKLHLSIHPLDYATASDNESDWSSCISWREGGAYRLGTVEMMTSKYVICAYLSSDSVQMDIGEGTWPSKKWRAWVIVDKDFIVVNRNYPYDNEYLMREAVEWVKEMAGPHFGVTYGETGDGWNQGEHIDIEMNYMYNDLGDGHIGCYSNATNMERTRYLNISGVAICMWCGEIITYDSDDEAACTLCCQACSGWVRCACCGTSLDRSYVNWGPDDEPYCESCYCDRFRTCECCDGTVDSDETLSLIIPVDKEWMRNNIIPTLPEDDKRRYVSWMPQKYEATVCFQCMKDLHVEYQYVGKLPIEREQTYWRRSANVWDAYMPSPHSEWKNVAELFGIDTEDAFWKPVWEHYVDVSHQQEVAQGF